MLKCRYLFFAGSLRKTSTIQSQARHFSDAVTSCSNLDQTQTVVETSLVTSHLDQWLDTVSCMISDHTELAIALTGWYIAVNLNNNNNFISKRGEINNIISELQSQTEEIKDIYSFAYSMMKSEQISSNFLRSIDTKKSSLLTQLDTQVSDLRKISSRWAFVSLSPIRRFRDIKPIISKAEHEKKKMQSHLKILEYGLISQANRELKQGWPRLTNIGVTTLFESLRFYHQVAFEIRGKHFIRGHETIVANHETIRITDEFEKLIKANSACNEGYNYVVEEILYSDITHDFLNNTATLYIPELSTWYSEILTSLGFMFHEIIHPGHCLDGESVLLSALFHYAAINIDSTNFKAHNNLGYALACLGDFASAQECFHSALDINHLYILTRFNLAHLLVATEKNYEEACRNLKATALLLDNKFQSPELKKPVAKSISEYVTTKNPNPNMASITYDHKHTFTELISNCIVDFKRNKPSMFDTPDGSDISENKRKSNYAESIRRLKNSQLNFNQYSYFAVKPSLSIHTDIPKEPVTYTKT